MSRPTNPQEGEPLDSSEDVPILQHDQYTIGWISALPIELAAAEGMLDVTHGPLSVHAADTNTYTLGSIGSHNIVVACLPRGHYGTNNAATVASNMRHSFPCIDRWLMVGIGGAVPHPDTLDIRLGDVVVSDQVLQYDFGKTLGDGEFELTSLPVRPSQALMTSVSKLQARHERESNQLEGLVATMMVRFPTMEAKFGRPKAPDCLFASSVTHVGSRPDCRACVREGMVGRARRQDESQPRVHYGVIASGNQVIKDAVTRDRLATKHGIICFEMEAAGLMDTLRCLVIRGICDYADSHKNKQWQGYAATVAAAYAKALLTMLPSSQRMITSQSESKRKEVLLRSLYFDWMDARQGAIKTAHQQTCEWLLKNELYRHWTDAQEYAQHRGFFWITGKPGAGKSTLLKFAYTQAQQNWQRTGDKAVVAFFFNARGTELEKTVKGMYRSILFQALQEMPSLQGVVLKALEDAHHPWVSSTSSKHDWDIQQLKSLLRTVIENLQHRHLICFVDALDECDQDEVEDMIQFFFEELGDLAWQRGSKFFVCLSSRHYPHLEIPVSLRLILEHQEGHSADVEKYVRTKLRAGSGSMQQDLTAQILRKASGVFLWAVLVVEILNKEIRSGRLFAMTRRLNELPGDLSALFKNILDKDRDNMDDLLLGIQWILFAARPLTEKEFYYALASGLDPDFKDVRWDPDYITLDHMERLVHSSTKGLAELTRPDEDDDHKDNGLEGDTPEEEEEDDDDDDDDYDDDYDDDNDDDYDNDKDMRFVQFIHESVRDFLLKDGGIGDLLPGSATLNTFAPLSHDRLKKCCDAYITASGVDLEKAKRSATSYVDYENFRRDLEENFPFMSYAVQYRFHHCNKAAETIPQIEYLSQFDIRPRIAAGTDSSAQCLPHFAAEYDYANILKELQGTSSLYINVQDCDGWTALLLAVQHGSIDTVKVLLSTPGVDVNQQNYRGLSPLAIAVLKGHVAILQILLAMPNINVNLPGKRGQTPLFWATREKVLSPLLDHPNIDINVTDDKGQTFLHQFIERGLGSKRLVEMVLQRHDFNTSILSVEDKGGDTPLSLAMRTQSYETVALVRAKTI